MKKTVIFALALGASVLSNAQINMTEVGKVGIGGRTTYDGRLRVYSNNDANNVVIDGHATESNIRIYDIDPKISFTNQNWYTYQIVNFTESPWNAKNALAVYDYEKKKMLMEFRENGTYIHNDFNLGAGRCNFYVDTKGRKHGSEGYVFNSKLNSTDDGFMIERSGDWKCSSAESAGIYFDSDLAAIWSAGDSYLLQVLDEDGMKLKWYIDGTGQAYSNSDKNRKEDIANIEGGLSKVLRLNGVNYRFRMTDEEYEKSAQLSVKNSNSDSDVNAKNPMTSGFIAQDLEKVIPEVVQTDDNGDKYVNYDGVIPYLVEGIKEQQTEIESLSNEVQDLKALVYELTMKLNELSGENSISEATSGNLLYQNTPNPCSENTVIKYRLSSSAKSAVIKIVDVVGRTLKSYDLQVKADGELTINAKEFAAGSYTYSLYVDGQLVDSKQMILTE